jgi:hypothetical protein
MEAKSVRLNGRWKRTGGRRIEEELVRKRHCFEIIIVLNYPIG